MNGTTEPEQPLQLSPGDEFQGVYRDAPTAIWASLLLKTRLIGVCELRIGIGVGQHEDFLGKERLPVGQSGDLWWSAREALDWLAPKRSESISKSKRRRPRSGWPKSLLTAIRWTRNPAAERSLFAFLIARDALLANLDEDDARLFWGLFQGETQEQMARRTTLKSQSTISNRIQRKGILSLLRSHRQLAGYSES